MRRVHPDSRRFYRSRPPILRDEKIARQSSVPRASLESAMPAIAAAGISTPPIPNHARAPDRAAAAVAARRAPRRLPRSNVFPRRQSAQIKAGLRDQLRGIQAVAGGADSPVFEEGDESQTDDNGGGQADEARNAKQRRGRESDQQRKTQGPVTNFRRRFFSPRRHDGNQQREAGAV